MWESWLRLQSCNTRRGEQARAGESRLGGIGAELLVLRSPDLDQALLDQCPALEHPVSVGERGTRGEDCRMLGCWDADDVQ